MGLFRKKRIEGTPASAFQTHPGRPLPDIISCVPFNSAECRLYYALRESVPVIDAAILKTVRLTGGFRAVCEDSRAQKYLDSVLNEIPVGGNRYGIGAFAESYLEQLLTCGTALGEIVTDTEGNPAGLFNAPLDGIEFRRAKNGFDIDILVNSPQGMKKVRRPELCLLGVLNPDPGALTGNSLLRGLPFVSNILLGIFRSIGLNWERAGNLRFAVTYNPKNDAADRAYAAERAQLIADEWSKAMKPGAEIRDFVAVGDVQIKVIGAESKMPDCEIPMRLILEQIIAKTGLPPFMLGMSWSTTERMSAQQADALTSELESYRRILTPVISRICRVFLAHAGFAADFEIVWDDITLQDEVEPARAALYRAQAKKIEKETE